MLPSYLDYFLFFKEESSLHGSVVAMVILSLAGSKLFLTLPPSTVFTLSVSLIASLSVPLASASRHHFRSFFLPPSHISVSLFLLPPFSVFSFCNSLKHRHPAFLFLTASFSVLQLGELLVHTTAPFPTFFTLFWQMKSMRRHYKSVAFYLV